jgi:hydroxymethylpyrimidine pyrophosphatase-like HAD family hydrolase
MYFLAVATDYDGTIAHHGSVKAETVAALKRCKESGRRLILVTGRELPDLKRAFSEIKLFDRVVAENGALIYDPSTEEERVIAAAPPAIFVERLKQLKVQPISVGHAIVATWEQHETTVLEVIRDLGLELHIIFNKGAVMVLPPGMNKAAGLQAAALRELEISPHNVVGVGDAENDHSFIHACGCAAAVANALPMVKEAADICLSGDQGDGVIELVERLPREDPRIVPPERHGVRLGIDRAGEEVYIEPHRGGILIAGSSGIGKSTLATALTERMAERGFEFCVLDPEGDYDELCECGVGRRQ